MTCTAKAAAQLREARRALVDHPAVLGADIHRPSAGETDRWAIELTLRPAADGLDGDAQLLAIEHGLTVHDLRPRGAGRRAILVR